MLFLGHESLHETNFGSIQDPMLAPTFLAAASKLPYLWERKCLLIFLMALPFPSMPTDKIEQLLLQFKSCLELIKIVVLLFRKYGMPSLVFRRVGISHQ
jgi:hypothetical protein